MFTQNKNKFVEVIDIILYKYNMIDSKLWGLIKKEKGHRKIDNDISLIASEDLKNIIINNFRSEINKFNSLEGSVVYKEATSIYFIWKMLEDMESLMWIKCNLNKNANYTRLVNTDSIKTIKFSLKSIRGTFRTFDYFNRHELPLVNDILYRSKILNSGDNYGIIKLANMLNSLDNYLNFNNTSDIANVASVIINELEDYELDNPDVLVITDFEDI